MDVKRDDALLSFVKAQLNWDRSRVKRVDATPTGEVAGRRLQRIIDAKHAVVREYEIVLARHEPCREGAQRSLLEGQIKGLRFALVAIAFEYQNEPEYQEDWVGPVYNAIKIKKG